MSRYSPSSKKLHSYQVVVKPFGFEVERLVSRGKTRAEANNCELADLGAIAIARRDAECRGKIGNRQPRRISTPTRIAS